MARDGAIYACQSCGAVQTKWSGQCPACSTWNTLVEELTSRPPGALAPSKASRKRFFKCVPSRGGRTSGSLSGATLICANSGPCAA